MEALRLSPYSEEFLCAGDEFETRDDLTGFTDEINEAVASIKAGRE
jgi:hypothetical protein